LEKLSLDKQKGINFSKDPDPVLHAKVGQQIRVACAQYRELKKCNSTYARCIRKEGILGRKITN
jgi:hypothetical protein